ncbi:hypothetical protein [Paenibacillus sp. sgz302251]|uniref:hypothetical protein n=1 Tax=Paenibacillus sp. sgz302251 TaxID=3414493 RepID=UPI003C7A2F68
MRIKDLFPSEDMLSRWIVGLSIIHNQLKYIEDQALSLLRRKQIQFIVDDMSPQFRYMCSTLREAIWYLYKTREEKEIKEFINMLPSHIKQDYETIMKFFLGNEDEDILQRMRDVRDRSFHFPKPNDNRHNELAEALESLQDQTIIEGNKDYFLFGTQIGDYIMYKSFLRTEEFNSEYERSLIGIKKVKEAFQEYIKFSRETIDFYISQRTG